MKALIPAAGFGTRLRPLTLTRPKPVLPVAGRPIIHYALEHLRSAGIQEIAVVVSDSTEVPLREALQDWPGLTYIRQNRMGGLGHAVLCAEEWAGYDDLCVMLADNLFESGPGELLRGFRQLGTAAAVALCEVEDPRAFGVATVLGDLLHSVTEKPAHPESNLAVAGMYAFTPRIFEALQSVPVSARGELELTDAIAWLLAHDDDVYAHVQNGWWKDTGRPADLLEANDWMLAHQQGTQRGTLETSVVQGNVVIEAGAVVRRSVIIGPAFIGAHAVIEDAQIGPGVSIGPGCVVRGAAIQHSILEAGASVSSLPGTLSDSILGQGACLACSADTLFHQCLIPDNTTLSMAGN